MKKLAAHGRFDVLLRHLKGLCRAAMTLGNMREQRGAI